MVDMLKEQLVLLGGAGQVLPNRPARATLWRWAEKGLHGVILETVWLGGRRYTSQEALQRFLERLNAARN